MKGKFSKIFLKESRKVFNALKFMENMYLHITKCSIHSNSLKLLFCQYFCCTLPQFKKNMRVKMYYILT